MFITIFFGFNSVSVLYKSSLLYLLLSWLFLLWDISWWVLQVIALVLDDLEFATHLENMELRICPPSVVWIIHSFSMSKYLSTYMCCLFKLTRHTMLTINEELSGYLCQMPWFTRFSKIKKLFKSIGWVYNQCSLFPKYCYKPKGVKYDDHC